MIASLACLSNHEGTDFNIAGRPSMHRPRQALLNLMIVFYKPQKNKRKTHSTMPSQKTAIEINKVHKT
ncbi:hypothetical protein B5X24_HaOG214744 [Helicoverpa armigera]|nr:hypothetical protein B5X24_HaOG214744 [Helicoverpa armigera]